MSTEKRTYNKLDFSNDDEILIIDFVKQHSLLFNPKDSDYKNKALRDKAWNDLGEKIGKSGCYLLNFLFIIRSALKQNIIHSNLRTRLFKKMDKFTRFL